MSEFRSYGVGATARFLFTTHAAAGGAVAPNSAFEAADVRIYKDGSATQRNTEAGYTMTSPFDSITGLHQIAVDLSDNTDAGFYAAGSYYEIVLSPDETIDSKAEVRVIGSFRIVPAESIAGQPKVDVASLLGTAWLTPGTAGTPDVNVKLISADATAADNAEAFFDGTGYAGTGNVIPTVTAVTGLTASDVGAIKAKTDNLPTDPADQSLIIAATDTIAGYLDTEVAAILAKTNLIPGTQDGLTFAQAIKLMQSVLLGKSSGSPGSPVFRSADDAANRVSATVDSDHNRTSVTLNP